MAVEHDVAIIEDFRSLSLTVPLIFSFFRLKGEKIEVFKRYTAKFWIIFILSDFLPPNGQVGKFLPSWDASRSAIRSALPNADLNSEACRLKCQNLYQNVVIKCCKSSHWLDLLWAVSTWLNLDQPWEIFLPLPNTFCSCQRWTDAHESSTWESPLRLRHMPRTTKIINLIETWGLWCLKRYVYEMRGSH